MGARKKIIKVIKAVEKAGLTPNDLRYIIFADMHEMLYEMAKNKEGFKRLLTALDRSNFDTDVIVERFEKLNTKSKSE